MRANSISVRSDRALISRSAAVSAAGHPLGSGVQLHKSGLLFVGKQSFSVWEQTGAKLFSYADSSTWWIADWLAYGESEFQDRYEEAIKQTSLSYQTLRNYAWVARRFPLPRRRQNLSFSHHFEVVALEQPEQDYWLRKAEELSWSRNKLRGEVRCSLRTRHGEVAQPDTHSRESAGDIYPVGAGPASVPAPVGVDATPEARLLHLQFSDEDLAKFDRAARKERQPVEAWARKILRRAAAGC